MLHHTFSCPLTACPKKDECARHSSYLKALTESQTLTMLNPSKVSFDANGCEHFIIPRQVRIAFGFKRLADTIPTGRARNMQWSFDFGSESSFYRTKRGERPLSPEEQALILHDVQSAGGDPTIGFDRYEEKIIYLPMA